MPQNFDLFGDPIPEGWGGRGRPPHIPHERNRHKVSMLVALGWSNKRIAATLVVDLKTLRKHYFPELKFREVARDRLDAKVAMKLWAEVEAGNVGAIKEFRKLLERNDLMLYGQTSRPAAPELKPPVKLPKLGKKEIALEAAQHPDTGTTLGDLMARRQGVIN